MHLFMYLLSFSFLLAINLFSQINTERYRLDSDSRGFSGIADIEITAITGNTDLQIIHLGGRLNYNWGESYTFLVADGGFGWDEGEQIFDQALMHIRHVHSVTELIQVEAFTQIDFNKNRLLNERELIGAGLRFRILKYDNLKLRLGTSYFFEHEYYDVSANSIHGNNLYASRFSSYLTLEYEIKDNVKLMMISYIQPQIGKWEDFRVISDNSLIVELSSVVDLKVSFNLRYDSKPPETIKSADTFTKFGFSFKL
ncbi:MAG: DUF481 domain-containing protein [Ignavibacteriaceae bacterium]